MRAHSLAVVATLNSPVTQIPPPPAPALGTHESVPAQSDVVWQAITTEAAL